MSDAPRSRPILSLLASIGPLLGLLLIAALLRAPTIGGPGYALDEEITAFAVRGIQQVGLPLFPSGVLSDRGLPYSYAAWIAGVVFGQELLSYRLISLLSGLAAVVGVYVIGRRLAGEAGALSGGLLLTIFPLHVAVSGWARFYALAVTAFIGSVALFLASQRRPGFRPWFVVSISVGVLVHELCIVLVALPF